MFQRCLQTLSALVLTAAFCPAQISASLKLAKTEHLNGEPVIAVVTVTNYSGRDLTFQGDGRFQWLSFIVKTSSGNPVNPRGSGTFGPMKIKAGQTLAREVDLSRYFMLETSGNFNAVAVINAPLDKNATGTSTNKVFFNQSSGRPYWSQKVGVTTGGKRTREYRLTFFTGDSKTRLFTQILDGNSGQMITTFPLGDVLMIRQPLVAVDRQQRMHVLYLATPSMWVHCSVNVDGKIVERQIHQRGPTGDPQLLTFGDGTVKVGNSIPYDAKAAAEANGKTRKASDRPAVTY